MFNLNPDQVEIDFAEDAVFQVELTLVEFEFNMQALFNSHLHLDRPVGIRFSARISHNEFLLLCYPVVISVDYHVDVVAQIYHDSIIRLKLLLHSVELEIIRHIIRQRARRL